MIIFILSILFAIFVCFFFCYLDRKLEKWALEEKLEGELKSLEYELNEVTIMLINKYSMLIVDPSPWVKNRIEHYERRLEFLVYEMEEVKSKIYDNSKK